MRITIGRDLATDIRKVVDEEIKVAGPTWTAAVVANRVVARLREEDPELLTKWLDMMAPEVIRKMVTEVSHVKRMEARRASANAPNPVFTSAVKRFEEGEEKALAAWLDTVYVVNTNNSRKKLRDMDQDDLKYAVNDYTARAKANAMQAAFLRALAEKVGARTVGEVYEDVELVRLWRSLS